MADFELAVAKTIANEGGDKYTETEGDRGGATKYGISLRFLEKLQLKTLTINDEDFNVIQSILANGKPTKETVKSLTLEQAAVLYKHFFWEANRYGEINDQDIAEIVFDMAVLMGAPTSNKWLQNILDVKMDGIIGDKTIEACNKCKWIYERSALFLCYIDYLVTICNKDKTQSKFLLGWLNRVMS